MSDQAVIKTDQQEMWAIVELMGHAQTAGRVTKPSEWGGLMRVDVPGDDGNYTTEFYGMSAIYRVKFVSEEVARAYAPKEWEILGYGAPIVTREEHDSTVRQLRGRTHELEEKIRLLQNRLTAVNVPQLTEPDYDEGYDNGPDF